MKFIVYISALLLLNSAFAKECEVFGISDSPQKLNCTFPGNIVNLTCKNGDYYLNSSRVTVAFHMEVEEGNVPLVFKSNDMQLTVVEDKAGYMAELTKGKTSLNGSCL